MAAPDESSDDDERRADRDSGDGSDPVGGEAADTNNADANDTDANETGAYADGFYDDAFDDLDGDDLDDLDLDDLDTDYAKPLPPEDRLWRHPSELGRQNRSEAVNPAPTIVVANPSRAQSIRTAVAGGLIGAALALGGIAMLGRLGGLVVIERPVISQPLAAPPETAAVAASATGVPDLTRKTAPAIARVEARTATGAAVGSAVAIREDGYLVTSADLVRGRDLVEVVLSAGERVDATVIGHDPYTNIGVIHLQNQQLRVPNFSDANAQAVGDQVVVLSAVPAGSQAPIVAEGIVSTPSRTIRRTSGQTLVDMIQVDASMTTGVTGGALISQDPGEVIGILSAVVTDEAGRESIGVATPTGRAIQVASFLIEHGNHTPAWLGVDLASVESALSDEAELADGALVTSVRPASPAALAGLVPSDIITGLNGHTITSLPHLVLGLRQHQIGEIVQLTYVRQGESHTALVILGEQPRFLS